MKFSSGQLNYHLLKLGGLAQSGRRGLKSSTRARLNAQNQQGGTRLGSSKLAYNSKAKAGGFNLVMDNKRVIQRLQLSGNSNNHAEQYKCQRRKWPHAGKRGAQIHFLVQRP